MPNRGPLLPVRIRDKVVQPGDPAYHRYRSTYTSIDSPALVVLVEGPDDIRDALAFANAQGLLLTVRSGGHSLSGASSNDGGLVLDLSRMTGVDVVDAAAGLVEIQPGARWGAVARRLAPHGLAISSGNYGNVGVGGLATTGGIGWMARRYGLTIDHLVGATVVLPDGTEVHADDNTAPDLFWAVRGAGAYVGIATGFRFRAARVGTVTLGQLQTRITNAARSLPLFDSAMAEVPRELTAELVLHGDVATIRAVSATADAAATRRAMEPLLNVGRPMSRLEVTSLPYPSLVPRRHEHLNIGQQTAVTHNGIVPTVTEEIGRLIGEAGAGHLLMQIRSLGGAMHDVPSEATAFAHRSQTALVIGTVFARDQRHLLDADWLELAPHFTGAYAGFESVMSPEAFALAYPDATGARLRYVKAKYDPDGVLRSLIV